MKHSPKRWWREKFITLMLIPERTRQVHKVVVPFFIVKLGVVLASLGVLLLVVLAVDYVHVVGRLSENKQLKGENFKLRQEIQLIRNKVETMESTIERVRNYAKKLQMLTGQEGKEFGELPWGPTEGVDPQDRSPAQDDRRSQWVSPFPDTGEGFLGKALEERVDRLQRVSQSTESGLSRLQVAVFAKSAILAATPSMIPIRGWLSSGFGYRRNPYDGAFKLHAGVDIAAEPGTPVRAPAQGVVVFAGYREGYGKVVVLDHGYGIRTLFAHCSRTFANSGFSVKRGEVIAEVGSTGHSTGPHLHYEIRKNGVPVNPATFFGRSRF